ncbi:Small acidic protein 1 [Balamuthia mandrillaris]
MMNAMRGLLAQQMGGDPGFMDTDMDLEDTLAIIQAMEGSDEGGPKIKVIDADFFNDFEDDFDDDDLE